MSDVNNSKRVKLSSVESDIKPEDEDEASAVEQEKPIAGCSDSSKRKTPKDTSVTALATATDTSDANGSDLVEDVLMLIFETDFLDTADLLHCRLVNRSWRDCATSVLLRSSACQISFNLLSVPIPSSAEFDATKPIYCNNNNHGALLNDLNEIISQSPKFPCSNFRFVNSYSFGDVHHKNPIDTSSLHNFFSIHGNNVKTITVGDYILKTDLRSLLLNYAPYLEFLDLQYLVYFAYVGTSICKQPLFPESTALPKLTTLVFGTCVGLNLMELVDVAINLQSVETTIAANLNLLLDHGKAELIKKLEYCLHVHDTVELSVFEKLADCQPKLTKLIVTAVRHPFGKSDHELPGSFLKTQVFLNRILESSKDTLKYLEFRICPFADIKFPVLKNLECLKLVRSRTSYGGCFNTLPSCSPLVFPVDLEEEDHLAARWEDPNFEVPKEVDARISGRCPNRPCGSFPNLQKVQLDIKNYGVERNGSLIFLHTCRSHNRNIVPHVYKTVKVLEIYSTLPNTIEIAKSVSNLFPNVTTLKIKCKSVKELNCTLWVLAPLAKSIEIYGLCTTDLHVDENEGDGSNNEEELPFTEEVVLVDSFFTGFPIEMCQKLKGLKQIPTEIEANPSLMNLMRVKPSICDLKNLTDFKIIFSQLSAPFASHVTGFYAFRNMPKTSFTFAHSEPIKFNEAECEMDKYMAPISTFVNFTHKNIPTRFDNDDDSDSDSDDDSSTES